MPEEKERDEAIRKDFARIFNWHEPFTYYGSSRTEKKYIVPTWAEIFFKVGQLHEAAIERKMVQVSSSPIE